MSERSYPIAGPKPLTSQVLKGIVGGAQDGDRQKVDDQTAIALTAGADEASPGVLPDAPSPGNAEGARGAATEAKGAPATVPLMAGEAVSQAADGATTDEGSGDLVVDQAPDHSWPPAADLEEGRELHIPTFIDPAIYDRGHALDLLKIEEPSYLRERLESDWQLARSIWKEGMPPLSLEHEIHSLVPAEYNQEALRAIEEKIVQLVSREAEDIPVLDILRVDS